MKKNILLTMACAILWITACSQVITDEIKKESPVIKYTITFDKNDSDATGDMVKQKILSGTSANLTLNLFSKTGWAFQGWTTSKNGAVEYTDGAIFKMGNGNVVLYAKWTINSYTITYNMNGATSGTAPLEQTFEYNTVVTISSNSGKLINIPPAGTAEAFKFGGWNTEANGKGITYEAGTGELTLKQDITLYAKWIKFEVGDTGPAGGIIFGDKGNFSNGFRYGEVALADLPKIAWMPDYDYKTTGARGQDVPTGKQNTDLIVTCYPGVTTAASECADYSVVYEGITYDDWYLPAFYELSSLYSNLKVKGLGNFADKQCYWSSTEYSYTEAWAVYFGSGYILQSNKNEIYAVRPCRMF